MLVYKWLDVQTRLVDVRIVKQGCPLAGRRRAYVSLFEKVEVQCTPPTIRIWKSERGRLMVKLSRNPAESYMSRDDSSW